MMLVFALLTTVLVFSLIATGWLSDALRRRRIMDVPGDRSSHTVSTPRGGGLAIVASVIAGTGIGLVASASMEAGTLVLLAGAAVLAGLSWIDDLKSLPPWVRFAAHIIVVATTLPMLGIEGTILPFDLPVWLDRVLVAIAWLGFLNFFNFMDGIDGISVVETTVIGGGILLVLCAVESMDADMLPLAVTVMASIGFGWWNWSPARVFMGDVGSVFLGYLLGGYLILLASEGFLAAAVILPAYYLVDAITTLVRRALKGERVWQAHRQHYYQQAVQAGRSHATVSLSILCTGLVLVALALVSLSHPFLAIGLAILLSAALCFWLPRAGGGRDS